MRKSLLGLTLLAGVSFGCFGTAAQAAPQIGAAMFDEPASNALLQDVALEVHVYRGRSYCFYFDGWHGAGWYRCGWAWRRGLGWGGVYGWNDWEYGPAARRFGHVGGGFRSGERGYSRGDVRLGTTGQGGVRMHDRGPGGAAIEGGRGGRAGGAAIESGRSSGGRMGTTGQGGMGARSGGGSTHSAPSGSGGATMQGGPSGGAGGGTSGGAGPGAGAGGGAGREH